MRFYGNIGFVETKETSPGVWTPVITERPYYGNVIRNSRRWEQRDKINDDVTIQNQISVIADQFCYTNLQAMKYVVWLGQKWSITDVEIERPRLTLSIGGVYNGLETEEDRTSSDT